MLPIKTKVRVKHEAILYSFTIVNFYWWLMKYLKLDDPDGPFAYDMTDQESLVSVRRIKRKNYDFDFSNKTNGQVVQLVKTFYQNYNFRRKDELFNELL